MPKEIATLFVFQSDSDPNKTYQCLQYVSGALTCDCRGWIFKRGAGPRSCRHTRYVEAGMGNRHAVRVVEYSKPARRTPQRAMPEPALPRGRKFRLDL